VEIWLAKWKTTRAQRFECYYTESLKLAIEFDRLILYIFESSTCNSTNLCTRRSFDDITPITPNFWFRLLVKWSSPHGHDDRYLPTKFRANSAIQYGVIDVFRNSKWRPPPSWIFKLCEFGTFRHVDSVVLELCTKFSSNICYSHGHRSSMHLCSRCSSDDVTQINFRFWVLVTWSSPHGCEPVKHLHTNFGANPFRSYWHFPKFKMALYEFGIFRHVDSVVPELYTKFGSNVFSG